MMAGGGSVREGMANFRPAGDLGPRTLNAGNGALANNRVCMSYGPIFLCSLFLVFLLCVLCGSAVSPFWTGRLTPQ